MTEDKSKDSFIEPKISGASGRPQIIILDSSRAFTGAFKATANIARSMAPWADTTLVLPVGSQIDAKHLLPFAQVAYVPMRQIRRSVIDLLLYVPALLAGSWKVHRLLARSGSGHVRLVVNDFFLLQGAVLRILGFNGPLVTWVRMDPLRFPASLSKLWLAAALRSSDHVTAVSEFIADRLPRSTKVRTVYDPVEEVSSTCASVGGTQQDIVFVGNYIRGKGQEHAIGAFARIAADYPGTILRFFGGDMGLEKNKQFRRTLEEQAQALGLEKRVIFNGFVDRIEDAFVTAAAVLNLSESESFSLTCLEASNFALPVIAFRSGGPEEIIVHGETGFLLDQGDLDGVADALKRLLSDPDLASAMGRAGSIRVRQQFSPGSFQKQLKALLRL